MIADLPNETDELEDQRLHDSESDEETLLKISTQMSDIIDSTRDVNKLKEQYYSTKGKGRGLGLFLANKLIKESESIDMVQRVEEDRFISEITVML